MAKPRRLVPKLKEPPPQYPRPEILLGGNWQIEDSPVITDPVACTAPWDRQMLVPLQRSEQARAIRLHEMAHVRWSPRDVSCFKNLPVGHGTVLGCEDYRVNALLYRHSPAWQECIGEFSFPETDNRGIDRCAAQDPPDLLNIAIIYMAACHSGRWGGYHQHVVDTLVSSDWAKVINAIGEARAVLDDDIYTYKSTLKAAKVLELRLKPKDKKPQKDQKNGKGKPEKGSYDEAVEEAANKAKDKNAKLRSEQEKRRKQEEAEEARRELEEFEKNAEAADKEEEGESEGGEPEGEGESEEGESSTQTNNSAPSEDNATGDKPSPLQERDKYSNVTWGPMTIEMPPLVRSIPLRKVGRAKRPTTDGHVLNSPHRIITDGRVFRKKRRFLGGSLLIDQSGSMHLTIEQVEGIVIASPTVIVASYAGNAAQGWLRVQVQKGRMCSTEKMHLPWGGNTVDYPALEWLAKQSEPRIWVSDGLAVPLSGFTLDPVEQCAEFAIKHRILRVDTADQAVDVLHRLR